MKFKDYIKLLNESNPEKRAVSGPYASLYPQAYALSYRNQYSPKKKDKKESK